MINFDFIEDNEFTNIVDNLISCLLPHEKYDGKYFTETLEVLTRFVHIDEMPCHYGVLVTVLDKMRKIVVQHSDYTPKLDRSQFDMFLGAGLNDYVDVNSRKITDWMSDMGELVNLDIPKDLEDTKTFIYQHAMELYDNCYQLEIESSSYPALVVALREAFKENAIIQGQIVQRHILSKGVFIGKRKYRGHDDYLEYSTSYLSEIQYRLSEQLDENTVVLDDLSKAEKMIEKNRQQSQVLCNYGIPELDDVTPMLRYRLVVLVAAENTGKTIYSCDLVSSLLVAGRKVVYMCGESPDNQILNKIIPSYIRKTTGLFVSETQCMGTGETTPEHERLIRVAMKEIVESGNLIFRESFTYDNVGQELRDLYQVDPFDAVIVDHSAALMKAPGSKLYTEKDCIDSETIQLREFKKKYPVFVFVDSHPSSDASKELVKLKRVDSTSPTRSTGLLSKEADELFIMYTTDELAKQSKVGIQIKKRRMAKVPRNHVYLKVDYVSLTFRYSDEDQEVSESIVKKEQLINEIENSEAVNEDAFDFNILDD